jgi:hypothetical protein
MDTQAQPSGEEPAAPERPEYISPQHWDEDLGEVRVESLAKSFSDTKKALDTKFEGNVPSEVAEYVSLTEEGTIQLPDGLDSLPAIGMDDPMVAAVLSAASENNITVEQMKPVMDAFFTEQNALYADVVAFDPDAVLAGVSDNRGKAEGIVDSVNVYLAGMELSEEHQSVAAEIMSSAGGIQFLNSLIGRTKDAPLLATQAPKPSFDRGAAESRWEELRGQDLRFGTPEYAEFESIGNQLFAGRAQK